VGIAAAVSTVAAAIGITGPAPSAVGAAVTIGTSLVGSVIAGSMAGKGRRYHRHRQHRRRCLR
jgi:hypothetical protein